MGISSIGRCVVFFLRVLRRLAAVRCEIIKTAAAESYSESLH